MKRQLVLLWLASTVLFVPLVAATHVPGHEGAGASSIIAPLVHLLGPAGLAGMYDTAPYLIDSILVLIIFIAVGQVAFKRFKSKALPVVIGIILAIGFGVFEFQMLARGTPFTLASFGPIAVLILFGFIMFFLYSLLPFVKNKFIRFLIAFTVVFAVVPPEVMAWLYEISPYFEWLYFVLTVGIIVLVIALFIGISRLFGGNGISLNAAWNKDVGTLINDSLDNRREKKEEKARQRRENAREAADRVGAAMQTTLANELQALTAGKQGLDYLRESVRTVNSYLTQVESLVAPQRKSGFDAATYRQQLAEQSGSQMEQHFTGQEQALRQTQAGVSDASGQEKTDEFLRAINEMKERDVSLTKGTDEVLAPVKQLVGTIRTNIQPKFVSDYQAAENELHAAEARSGKSPLSLGLSRAVTLDNAHARDFATVQSNLATLDAMHKGLADVTGAYVKHYAALTAALQKRKAVFADAKSAIMNDVAGELRSFQQHAKDYLQALDEKPRKKAAEAAEKLAKAIDRAEQRLQALAAADTEFEQTYAAYKSYESSGSPGSSPAERTKQFDDLFEQTRASAVQIVGYVAAARIVAQTARTLGRWYPPNPPEKPAASAAEAVGALTALRGSLDKQMHALVESELKSLAGEASMADELKQAIAEAEGYLLKATETVIHEWSTAPTTPSPLAAP